MGAVGRCDLGKVRSQNEDSIYISENPDTEFEYFIVADGMGGHNAGEIASQSAIKFFNEYIEDSCDIKDSSDLLDAYCSWLFPILSDLEERIGFEGMDAFQSRWPGRVSERLLDPWLETNGLDYAELPVVSPEPVDWVAKGKGFLAAKFLGKKYEKSF